MTKLNAFWRAARIGALGLAVAIVIGVAAQPAEARDGHWRWNGVRYVWIAEPYYGGYYYPPAPYYYPPPPAPVYYGYPGYYYGPSVGLSFRFH